jgi:hypothetical protein
MYLIVPDELKTLFNYSYKEIKTCNKMSSVVTTIG